MLPTVLDCLCFLFSVSPSNTLRAAAVHLNDLLGDGEA
jgi:hypothetical protein